MISSSLWTLDVFYGNKRVVHSIVSEWFERYVECWFTKFLREAGEVEVWLEAVLWVNVLFWC
jgi:hypothetical protein